MTPEKNRPRRWGKIVSKTLLVVVAVGFVSPFVWMLFSALKPSNQVLSTGAALLGDAVRWDNFAEAFSSIPFGQILVNTFAYALVGTLITVVVSVLNAYAFARLRFPGRRALFWAYVATLMVPPIVTVIPLFSMFSQLGLRNTFAGLVAPFLLGSPYAIFLLRQNFQAIPQEVLDAATLDGAGHWRTLRSIVLPMNRPILAALTLITVVSQWNAFLWPSVIAPGRTWSVLTVATQALQEERSGNWTLVMAATTVALAPLVVLFLAFNRQIVAALGIGDVR